MNEQKYASVWPYVQIGRSYNSTENRLMIDVSNNGVGPAKITDMEYVYKDSTYQFIQQLAKYILFKNGVKKTSLTYANLEDGHQVLIPGQTVEILEIVDSTFNSNEALLSDFYQVQIQIKYCSLYDQCWLNLNGSIRSEDD